MNAAECLWRAATLPVPQVDVDHDANDVPLSSTTLKNSALHFEAAGGSFDGILSKDESTLEGTWALHGVSTHLRLKRVNE